MDKSLSRRAVQCAECNEEFSSQFNLKSHYGLKHPNKPCLVKGQTVLNFATGSKRKHDGTQTNILREKDDSTSAPTSTASNKKMESPIPETTATVTVKPEHLQQISCSSNNSSTHVLD